MDSVIRVQILDEVVVFHSANPLLKRMYRDIFMLHSHIIHMQLYTYTYGNIFNTIKTSGHRSLENIPLTLFERITKELRKGHYVRGELETEQRLQHIDPHSSGYSIISFSLGSSTGGLGTQPLLGAGSQSSNWNTDFNF